MILYLISLKLWGTRVYDFKQRHRGETENLRLCEYSAGGSIAIGPQAIIKKYYTKENKMPAYEDYEVTVAKVKATLPSKPLEVSNTILYLKSAGCSKACELNEECFTFTSEDGKFGFNEKLVNQLMQYAYNAGRESLAYDKVVLEAVERGKKEKFDEVAKILGLYTEDDLDNAYEQCRGGY